jgi:hypothetical protein
LRASPLLTELWCVALHSAALCVCVSSALGLWGNPSIADPLPASLSALTALTYFSVADTSVTSLPNSLSTMTNLQCVPGPLSSPPACRHMHLRMSYPRRLARRPS